MGLYEIGRGMSVLKKAGLHGRNSDDWSGSDIKFLSDRPRPLGRGFCKSSLYRSIRAINDLCLRASLTKPTATDTTLTATLKCPYEQV